MSTLYAADHASALADVQAAGAAITLTRNVPGTFRGDTGTFYDPTTGRFTFPATDPLSTVTVAAYAIEVPGNPEIYAALSLTTATATTLFIVCATYGDRPMLGDSFAWAGATLTVADVTLLAPDGTPIAATVVARR